MSSTTIHTLRLRTAPGKGARSRQAALRHQASTWLGMADLHPTGLPPAAILHVRRLPDPVAYASGRSVRPSQEWQHAVRSAMEETLRDAKKPVRGILPASADAVVFASVAEQIATLSLDLVYARATVRWWWTPVLQSVGAAAQPLGQRLARVLTHDPDATPAVIAYLAEWGQLGTVLPVMSPLEAEWVLRAWAPRHGISLPASSPPLTSDVQPQLRTRPHREPSSPWGDAVERVLPHGLSRVHRALAGVALACLRAPYRSGVLSRDLARWWERSDEPFAWSHATRDVEPASADALSVPDRFTADVPDTGLPDHHRDETKQPRQTREADAGVTPSSQVEDGRAVHPEPQTDEASEVDADEERHEIARTFATAPNAENDSMGASEDGPPASRIVEDVAPVRGKLDREDEDKTFAGSECELSSDENAAFAPFDREREAEIPFETEKPALTDASEDVREKFGGRSESDHPMDSAASPSENLPAEPSTARSEKERTEEASEDASRSLDETTWRPRLETQVFASDLGGAIYLVNLLRAFGWTGLGDQDETTSFETRVRGEASPWAVLEAVVRGLLASCITSVQSLDSNAFADGDLWADDLWAALTALDGRPEGAAAGADLNEMSAFVAPPKALLQVEPSGAQATWCIAKGRLRVGTERCLWADLRAPMSTPADTAAPLVRAIGAGRYPAPRKASSSDEPFGFVHTPVPPGLAPVLRQWLQCALPLVLERLRQVLGADPFTGALADCLLVPATIHLEPMHLDVTLPLDAISLPVRLAGLDQSPGWAPAFGKVIRIHFL